MQIPISKKSLSEPEKLQFRIGRYRTGSIYAGKKHGLEAREYYDLDYYDNMSYQIIFIVPEDTTSFNSSFFIGLFKDSIKKLGMINFENKYKIILAETNSTIRNKLNADIADGKRYFENSSLTWLQKLKRIWYY